MSAFVLLCSLVLVDAEFVKTLLDCGESAWEQFCDETTPPEQDLEMFADLADKLARLLPRQLLRENVADSLLPQSGETVRLEGNVIFVTKYDGKMPMYRCQMELNSGGTAGVFVPSIPQAWEQNVPIQERAALFGIYIKSYEDTPLFAAPAIEWYPNTWLGNLGFNVASFDQVPVCRVTELEQHDEETNRRIFKFTESDVEPFYGLFRAISATSEGWLEAEAKKQQANEAIGVTDLFNRPGETRGKPVLLHGVVKRVVSTPVTDSAVQSLFGIDHYYQMFLYTQHSRGNPIVVCVRSLPEGMPIGDADHFSESITVAAVPYKLWIYETPEGAHYAPLLIGRQPAWHPKPAWQRQAPAAFASFSFAAFFALALIWFACRLWARKTFRAFTSSCVYF